MAGKPIPIEAFPTISKFSNEIKTAEKLSRE